MPRLALLPVVLFACVATSQPVASKTKASPLLLAAPKISIGLMALAHRLLYSSKATAGKISRQPHSHDVRTVITATFEKGRVVMIVSCALVNSDSLTAKKTDLIVNKLFQNRLCRKGKYGHLPASLVAKRGNYI